jgi:hypothetical protein
MVNASGDADLLIAKMEIEAASKSDNVLVGDDTDLLVLVCFPDRPISPYRLFFIPEPKQRSLNLRECLDIGVVHGNLSESVWNNILFADVFLDCDITSIDMSR